MEKLLEDVSFRATDMTEKEYDITAEMLDDEVATFARGQRFVELDFIKLLLHCCLRRKRACAGGNIQNR